MPLAAHGSFEFKTYALRRSDGRYDGYYAIRRPGSEHWLRNTRVLLREGFSSQAEALNAADWEARTRIDRGGGPA
jgi:hypothetical protein